MSFQIIAANPGEWTTHSFFASPNCVASYTTTTQMHFQSYTPPAHGVHPDEEGWQNKYGFINIFVSSEDEQEAKKECMSYAREHLGIALLAEDLIQMSGTRISCA